MFWGGPLSSNYTLRIAWGEPFYTSVEELENSLIADSLLRQLQSEFLSGKTDSPKVGVQIPRLLASSGLALRPCVLVDRSVGLLVAQNRFYILSRLRKWDRLHKLIHAVIRTSRFPVHYPAVPAL